MKSDRPHLSKTDRRRLSGPALLSFLEASSDWKLSDSEELACAGYPDPGAFQVWSEAAIDETEFVLQESMLLRIADVSAVARTITRLLPRKQDRLVWLRSDVRGPVCRGMSPLEILSDPDDFAVMEFRRRLDEWSALPFLGRASYRRAEAVPKPRAEGNLDALWALINGGPSQV